MTIAAYGNIHQPQQISLLWRMVGTSVKYTCYVVYGQNMQNQRLNCCLEVGEDCSL